MTSSIIDKYRKQIHEELAYTKSELAKLQRTVFIPVNHKEDRKKREPTKYNLFVKEQMPLIKEEFPDLNRQDLMRKVGEMWKNTNKSPKSSKSPQSPKSPKSIKRMIDKNYPELNSIEKQKLLDNLLKTSIYWKM
jgi:hypothetical protein